MKNFKISSDNDEIAIRSYGENGKDILCVHGTGQNLAVWEPLAKLLKNDYKIWTFDTRGHGKTTLDSENATQYWKDIDHIINKLNIQPVLLLGHSTGGFSVAAYTAWKQSKIPIMVLDGFVLDVYEFISKDHPSKIPNETLWELFRYGWEASEEEKDQYINNQVEKSTDSNNLNYGVQEELITKVLDRSFFKKGKAFIKRPTFEEIERVGHPDKKEIILPDIKLYDKITSAMAMVVATEGFYYQRKKEIEKIVAKRSNRSYFEIKATHNLPMTEPEEIKKIIFKFMSEK